jgi:virginiamycin B lyase
MIRHQFAAVLASTLLTMMGGSFANAQSGARPSNLLELLPDGEEKRKFILDCMGCHSLNDRVLYVNGELLDEAGHTKSVNKMLMFAGAKTLFPVMSPERDAASTGSFLAQYLTEDNIAKAAAQSAEAKRHTTGFTVTEWDIPNSQDLPHDLMVGSDGSILVTGMMTGKMYILDPKSGEWETRSIPSPGGNPRALDIGLNGDWWIAGGMTRKMSRYRASEDSWDHYDMEMYPHSVMADSKGRIWFNGHFTFDPIRMGYIDSESDNTVILDVPPNEQFTAATPIPYGLRVGADDTVWSTELGGNRLLKYTPDSKEFASYYLPSSYSGPRRLDIAADGTVWVPEFATGKIAHFDPRAETFTEYDFPTRDSLPYCARIDHTRGAVWVSQCANDTIARIDLKSKEIVEFALLTPVAFIRHIDVDQKTGDVYAAYSHSPGLHPKVVRLHLE